MIDVNHSVVSYIKLYVLYIGKIVSIVSRNILGSTQAFILIFSIKWAKLLQYPKEKENRERITKVIKY